MSTPFRLQVPRRLVEEMVAQAQRELPNECCGFLAGKLEDEPQAGLAIPLAQVVKRYPLVNAAASPTAYFGEPAGMFAAHKDMRAQGIELLAIYHSHPTSAPVPSRRDLEQNQYPGLVHFIISLQAAPPLIRAWWLMEDSYQEAAWVVDG